MLKLRAEFRQIDYNPESKGEKFSKGEAEICNIIEIITGKDLGSPYFLAVRPDGTFFTALTSRFTLLDEKWLPKSTPNTLK